MTQSPYVLAAVLTPFVAALLILLCPRSWAKAWSWLACLITACCVVPLPAQILAGGMPGWHLLDLLPGVAIGLRVDALGVTFGCLAAGLWVITNLYSIGYVQGENLKNRRRYYASFAAAIGTALGIAFSSNLLTFLLFYEMLTLATWPLVAHKETPEAITGGRRYLVYTLLGGLGLTVAVAWTWAATGQLEFTAGGFLGGQSRVVTICLFALFMFGCGVKAAIMPAHAWLPAAMVAPTPVSALLHAVAVVKAGVFGCLRVLGFVFGPESLAGLPLSSIIVAMCAITIVVGSILALGQDHLKRRLAYSTVVHLSYIVLGAALLTPLATTGAVLHLVNHGLTKITLFFCAGAIYVTLHQDHISQMRGMGRRMPWTFGAFTVASLSLIGIPGLCGFVSKLFLVRGALQAESYVIMAVMIGGSVLTASYLLPVVWTAFFEAPDTPDGKAAGKGEADWKLLAPLLATAGLTLLFGIFPGVINSQVAIAWDVAAKVFGVMP